MPDNRVTAEDHAKNNLPDVLARWAKRSGSERKQRRTAQSFCVPKKDIATQGYDLSLNPLQGGRARGDRASKAEGNSCGPREVGGGNSARDEGAGEDAVNAVALTRNGWTKCRLGECLQLINGRAYSQSELLDSGYRFFVSRI